MPKKVKALAKTTCLVCKTTANSVAANKSGSVKCTVCDGWWHPHCVQMSQETFKMITDWTLAGHESMWKCQTCDRASAKLMKMVTALSSKVGENEKQLAEQSTRLDKVEDKDMAQDMRLDGQEKEIKELCEVISKLSDKGGASAVREMDERATKENNLVFHRVVESGEGEARLRIAQDKVNIQELSRAMGVEVGVDDFKFVRRLGPGNSDTVREGGRDDPRPLLVGFVHRHHAELVVQNSWRLAEADILAMREVSVVKDLTQRQRAGERELFKEAARKNLSRSRDNIEGNFAFKIVGKRGAKREILAPLRNGEFINEDGEVVWTTDTGGATGGSKTARGGRRTGPAAATYPNCVGLGRPGGTDQSLGIAREQSLRGALGRGGGRERGGGVKRWRMEGNRDYQQEAWGHRDVQQSTPDRTGPPEKRVDSRDSPKADTKEDSSPNPDLEVVEVVVEEMVEQMVEQEEDEEVEEDTEEMV